MQIKTCSNYESAFNYEAGPKTKIKERDTQMQKHRLKIMDTPLQKANELN